MKTKIVYILVAEKCNEFVAMLCMSLHTLRRHNPNAEAYVVMDNATMHILQEYCSPILKMATPLVVDIPSEYNIRQSSRFLKTTLRDIVQGDFLYLDVDTLITNRLDEIDQETAEIAMVADLNDSLLSLNPETAKNCRAAGFLHLEREPYFNSGVIFVRDTMLSHQLFATWHQNWKLSLVNGILLDQPALCEANRSLFFPIKELGGVWNCQFRMHSYRCYGYRKYLRGAKILHYFSFHSDRNHCFAWERILKFLLNRIMEKGKVDIISAIFISCPRLLVYANQLHLFLHRKK